MNQDSMKRIPLSSNAPKWRIASDGLCVEGYCENSKCDAHETKAKVKSMVVMPMGYGDFDMLYDRHKCKCPLCKEDVYPKTCGFINCRWKFTGMKGDAAGTPAQCSWQQSSNDKYDRFSDVEPDQVKWSRLVLFTKSLNASSVTEACNLCLVELDVGRKVETSCGHKFHKSCLEEYKKIQGQCPSCRNPLNISN